MPVPWGAQGFIPVREVIRRALAQGCVLRNSQFPVTTPQGFRRVRYFLNPANGGTYDMSDYQNDEFMAPSCVQAAERRLGVKLTD